MPAKSTIQKPRFKTEAEEADWYHTAEGKLFRAQAHGNAVRKGKTVVDKKVSLRQAMESARTGKVVVLKKGVTVKPTDPAVLQELVDRVNSQKTQAVSLRIPVCDIEAAKKIAAQTGLGYQTVLKEIISRGLR